MAAVLDDAPLAEHHDVVGHADGRNHSQRSAVAGARILPGRGRPAQAAVQRALETGAAFLLRYDPALANYPYTERISSTWFKLGFPLSYWSDVLENVAVLTALGYGHDPRVANAVQWILDKQDAQGRWKLENSLNGKMWFDIEKRGKPSKWVTLRVLRVLKAIDAAA